MSGGTVRWLVGLALALAGCQPSWAEHRFDVLETELRFPVRLVEGHVRGDSATFVVEVSDSAAFSRSVSAWEADPIVRGLRVRRRGDGRTELVLVRRARPSCRVRWSETRGELVIRVSLQEPADAEFYLEAGKYFASHGNPRLALKQYRKALALRPGDLRPYLEAARARLALGERRLAAFNARRALADPRLALEARALLERIAPKTVVSRREGAKAETPAQRVAHLPTERGALPQASAHARDSLTTEKEPPAETKGVPAESKHPKNPQPLRNPVSRASVSTSPVSTRQETGWLRVAAMAMILASGIMAPVVLLVLRSFRRTARVPRARLSVKSEEFERARQDVFERLLTLRLQSEAETLRGSESEGRDGESAPPAAAAAPEESEERSPRVVVERAVASEAHVRAGSSFRSQLESVYALADRGVTVAEIARRLGIGREEVRLALEVRAARPAVDMTTPHRELTLELVED